MPSTGAARLVNSIKTWAASSAIWVVVIGGVVLVFDIRRILRVDRVASAGAAELRLNP